MRMNKGDIFWFYKNSGRNLFDKNAELSLALLISGMLQPIVL